MLTVSDLANAKPQLWRAAADDAADAAWHCKQVAAGARDLARTLEWSWPDDAGRAARQTFVRHADTYEAAGTVLSALVTYYDEFAVTVEGAQRSLVDALNLARGHGLTVNELGVVVGGEDTGNGAQAREVADRISAALTATNQADANAANRLRTIGSLTRVTDPAMIRLALEHAADSPAQIAQRMLNRPDDMHPLNIPPELFDTIRRAAAETGISETLLMSILWQEQQWYQNVDRDGGPLAQFGRFVEWVAQQTFVEDKSLGIAHMELDTAREVIAANPEAFSTADGRYLGDLSDAELVKYIETYPEEDIRLAAYQLAELQNNPHGAATDKQLFLLYSTGDHEPTRDANAQYADATEPRKYDIRDRAENWDRLQPRLNDAAAWAALSPQERRDALDEVIGNKPRWTVDLHPVYDADGYAGDGRKPR